MTLIIICAILGGLYGAMNETPKVRMIFMAAGGVLAGTVLGFLANIIPMAYIDNTAKVNYHHETSKLVALSDYTGFEGRLVVGTGFIGTEEYYFYYYELPSGGKKFQKINAKLGEIYEENRRDALLIKTIGTTSITERGKIIKNIFKIPFHSENLGTVRFEIHTPKGTIKEGYNIDLK